MYGFSDCWKQARGNTLVRVFVCIPTVLDRLWRYADLWFNRSHGGLARWLRIEGYAPMAVLLPAALLVFLVYGPTLGWRGRQALLLVLAGWGVLYAAARWFRRGLFGVELTLLALWSLLVWWRAPVHALEVGPGLYRHFFIPLYLGLIVVPLVLLRIMAHYTKEWVQQKPDFSELLSHVNLFAQVPDPPRLSVFTMVRAFVLVPIQYPLHFLFVPAIVVLFLPYYFSALVWAITVSVVWWVLLSSFADHRIGNTLHLMRRAFFIGGQLVVSLVVIVLAVGRVAGVSYVQTVVESSNWRTLFSYIVSAYVAFWFQEYWLNRMLLDKLLRLLGRPEKPGQIEYELEAEDLKKWSKIEPAGRRIQIHGGGRLLSVGRLEDSSREAFEPFEKRALFDELVRKAAWSPVVGETARSPEGLEKLQQIHRGVRFYFSAANLLLIGLAVGAGLLLTHGTQHAALEVPVRASDPERKGDLFHLADRIWQGEPKERVILLAASGGGTRAALYAHSVLHGLARLGALDDVVLGSGVSGGGTALAYFGAHRDELLASEPDDEIWHEFACDLSSPFIWDVLRGVSEWRIVTGTRAGNLLQESFERGFGFPQETPAGVERRSVPTLGRAGYGLIFNTGLAGHLEVARCGGATDFADAASSQRQRTTGSVGGGRLILTNLDTQDLCLTDHPGLNLPYVVIDDLGVPLTTAAALHANFPPVFSNAPIDRVRRDATGDWTGGDRYWVTDGGAVDNRGMISLLLTLRNTLHQLSDGPPPKHLPQIHIVMAEASGGSRKYSQDRGVGTAFGAAGKVASQLLRELLEEVKQLYGEICIDPESPTSTGPSCGQVFYHDLPMPDFLRTDGGLGTHWMMPRTVEMHRNGETVVLDSAAVRWLIDALHRPDRGEEPPRCEWETTSAIGRGLDTLRNALGIREPRSDRLDTVFKWDQQPPPVREEPPPACLSDAYRAETHRQGWDRFRCLYVDDCNGGTGPHPGPSSRSAEIGSRFEPRRAGT